MIYVFSEIKGYVSYVAEGPAGINVVDLRKKFLTLLDDHDANKPTLVPPRGDEEIRHAEYKEYMNKMAVWDAEHKRILRTTCGGFTDATEAFVQSLVANFGFKIMDFEQTEMSDK